MRILRQYTENDLIVTEYTNDGYNIVCIVKEAINIELPPTEIPALEDPIVKLEKANAELKAQLIQQNQDLQDFMDFYFSTLA
jgi:hypothetical protein